MNTQTPALTPERILQRLDWKVIRRLDGLLQGDYRSLFYGYGIDFADLREYQPEDDIRYIDWNVTARMDTPYVRQYVEDREVTAWFLLDLSPSMDFGNVQNDKRAVLIDLVTTLARILTRHGNRVGAMFYTGQKDWHSRAPNGAKASGRKGQGADEEHAAAVKHAAEAHIDRTIPARGGRNQVLLLASNLLKQPHIPRAPFTNLAPLLEGGLHAIKRRSLVFVISDFISAPGWERPLSLLNQRHEVLAVRLWDPREVELPDVGPVIIEDAETGEQMYVDTSDRKFRARFEAAARQRETVLSEAVKHAGVDLLSLSTEEDMVRALVRFAAMRKQRRQ